MSRQSRCIILHVKRRSWTFCTDKRHVSAECRPDIATRRRCNELDAPQRAVARDRPAWLAAGRQPKGKGERQIQCTRSEPSRSRGRGRRAGKKHASPSLPQVWRTHMWARLPILPHTRCSSQAQHPFITGFALWSASPFYQMRLMISSVCVCVQHAEIRPLELKALRCGRILWDSWQTSSWLWLLALDSCLICCEISFPISKQHIQKYICKSCLIPKDFLNILWIFSLLIFDFSIYMYVYIYLKAKIMLPDLDPNWSRGQSMNKDPSLVKNGWVLTDTCIYAYIYIHIHIYLYTYKLIIHIHIYLYIYT